MRNFHFRGAADKRPPPSSQDDFQSQQPVRKKAHVTKEPEDVPDTVHTVDSEVRAAIFSGETYAVSCNCL